MDWQNIFFPVSLDFISGKNDVGNKVTRNEGASLTLEGKSIAFFSVEEGAPTAANTFRKSWYGMRNAAHVENFVDLGDFIVGKEYGEKEVNELGYALSELMEHGLTTVAVSSVPQLFSRAVEKAHDFLKKPYTAVEVNNRIADSNSFGAIDSPDWLTRALQQDTPYLRQYGLLGYQTFYVGEDQLDYLDKLGFECHRLGAIKGSLIGAEPMIRSANYLKCSCEAIQAHVIGNAHQYPNGLSGEEACALLRFAGASPGMKLVSMETSDGSLNPVSAELFAQMLWYFCEGTLMRYEEDPLNDEANFTKYVTHLDRPADNIIFYKSTRTDKWWMYLPVEEKKHPESEYLIPCSYADYQQAASGEVPNKWLSAVNRLSLRD